jgi:hypothetical protein
MNVYFKIGTSVVGVESPQAESNRDGSIGEAVAFTHIAESRAKNRRSEWT